MDVSYNINQPKSSNGTAPIAYSPWLELFQLGGTRSQCMACHARAAFGKGVVASYNPKDPTTTDPNGFEASPDGVNDPAFQRGTVSLHRIWTILPGPSRIRCGKLRRWLAFHWTTFGEYRRML